MATIKKSHTELNPIQVSLLRLFNRPMSETLTLKNLMVDHYCKLLEKEVTKSVSEKGYKKRILTICLMVMINAYNKYFKAIMVNLQITKFSNSLVFKSQQVLHRHPKS